VRLSAGVNDVEIVVAERVDCRATSDG